MNPRRAVRAARLPMERTNLVEQILIRPGPRAQAAALPRMYPLVETPRTRHMVGIEWAA